MNSSNVGASRGAVKEGANVPRHRYSALPFATVVDCALRTGVISIKHSTVVASSLTVE